MTITRIKNYKDLKKRLEEAGERLVVLDFKASWCGPCQEIAPKVQQMAHEMGAYIVFLEVDVDKCEDIADDYNVNSMPAFVFIRNGKKLQKYSGANLNKLRNTIYKHM